MRAAGRANPLRGLTLEEDQELERLHKQFPSLGPYEPYVPISELLEKRRIERERNRSAESKNSGARHVL
jgi:hypothetical protein